YDGVFDAVKWSLDAPLNVVNNIAGCVHDELASAIERGAFDVPTIAGNVRNRLLALGASDWTIAISIQWVLSFSVTIPGSHLLGIAIDTVLQDTGIMTILTDIVSNGTQSLSAQAQFDAASAKKNGDLTQLSGGQTSIDQLKPTSSISVKVVAPVDQQVYQNVAPLQITISGANPTFCTALMGMPSRIRLVLNGTDFMYDPQQWNWDGTILQFQAQLVSRKTVLVPQRIQPIFQLTPLTIQPGITIKANPLVGGQGGFVAQSSAAVGK